MKKLAILASLLLVLASMAIYWLGGIPRVTNEAVAHILGATPACHARTIHLDRTMAGFAITGVAAHVGYLQRLAVEPAAQRHGLGRALVADSLAWMRQRDATRAMVNTAFDNAAALALYASFGFRARDESLVILELPLDVPV
jgi:ribosomal protein S18 acetylase RimI-like enzyme